MFEKCNATSLLMKLVSTITPVYNCERYLEIAINSILATGYPNLEIIIVDDGSTDSSLSIAQKMASEDQRIRVFQHAEGLNRGAGPSRNFAVEKSHGEYIAFLDADDCYLPNRFSRCIDLLESNPDFGGVCETTQKQVEEGGEQRADKVRDLTVFDCENPDQVLDQRLNHGLAWSMNAITLRKTVFEKAGGFPALEHAEDAALWLKLACMTKLVPGSTEPVAIYRIHSTNTSSLAVLGRYSPISSYVISEVTAWASTRDIDRSQYELLERALVGKLMVDVAGLRSDGQYAFCAKFILRFMFTHKELLLNKLVWKNLVKASIESIREKI